MKKNDIINEYLDSFVLLNQFDSDRIPTLALEEADLYQIDISNAMGIIDRLKGTLIGLGEATQLFGNKRDESFEGILKSVEQSFGGQYLYPSVEERATNLFYFIVKNHPFSDGNKRIGALMFVWYLSMNNNLISNNNNKINKATLVSLTILIAQSAPSDRELIVKLICNLIN